MILMALMTSSLDGAKKNESKWLSIHSVPSKFIKKWEPWYFSDVQPMSYECLAQSYTNIHYPYVIYRSLVIVVLACRLTKIWTTPCSFSTATFNHLTCDVFTTHTQRGTIHWTKFTVNSAALNLARWLLQTSTGTIWKSYFVCTQPIGNSCICINFILNSAYRVQNKIHHNMCKLPILFPL